ncbi:hypothetical protein J2Z40_002950 [Cytobacillus eiseniae]|uniref:SbsC C-terminal domain-containing protein n=1 Tax=Cytobacillus eiseniae TaxID=762947 RepID=A0ABS4RHM3_9BACI|nr:hypothetical protein [Cytobacillus eiseniae]MBP2242376.1 hypothetical protein [Cytobacillus eiseniae]
MKKKAIKIAASTAVAASAFVAAAPVNKADAAVNVDQIVQDAQNAGTVLKWAISVEGSADYVTRPYDAYNAAKKAIDAAEKALKGASFSDQLKYEARLTDPKIQVKRAQAYIDAITSSEKIKDLTAGLVAAEKTGDLDKVEAAYHKATAEYRKQASLLDKVYGQSTRDGIRNAVKPALEKAVDGLKNEVTVHMLAREASELAKADKLEDAAKKLTDAQAILDANVLKWEKDLQKSVDDVADAMPLKVLAVSSDNKNTVTVKFSKKIQPGYAVLPAGQFTFTNGLIVQSATVAADGKTVTLVTTDQKANTEYVLSYQGTATGKAFKTPANAVDSTLTVVETEDVNLDATGERSYTVNVTKADGTAYTGKVAIQLFESDKKTAVPVANVAVKTINGSVVTPVGNVYEVTAVNGKVTFVVKDNNTDNVTTTVVPKVTRLEDDVYKFAPSTKFWVNATGGVATATTVDSVVVDTTNGFLYVGLNPSGTVNEVKYTFDSNDKFYFKNVEVSQADFFKALSVQDKVRINYVAPYAKSNVSEFILDVDVTADAPLKVTNPNGVLTADTNATRLEGTGQPGHIIEVYKGSVATGNAVDSTVVNSNGSWVINSLNLVAGQQNDFVVTSRPVGSSVPAATVNNIHIYQAYYATIASTGLTMTEKTGNTLLDIGDEINFTFSHATLATTNNALKVADGATIKLKDGLGYTRTYKVAKVDHDTVKITDIIQPTVADGYNNAYGATTLTLMEVTGITNQDNLVFNVSESKDLIVNP